jgi:hypothetical protein
MLNLGAALQLAVPLLAVHQTVVHFLLNDRRNLAEHIIYQIWLRSQGNTIRGNDPKGAITEGTYTSSKDYRHEISYMEAKNELNALNSQIKILACQSIYDAIHDFIWPRKHWHEK